MSTEKQANEQLVDKAIVKVRELGGEVLGSGPDIIMQYKHEKTRLAVTKELIKDGWFLVEDEDDSSANLLTFTRSKNPPAKSRFRDKRVIRPPLVETILITFVSIACLFLAFSDLLNNTQAQKLNKTLAWRVLICVGGIAFLFMAIRNILGS
jgi:hypothetical protein